MILTRQQFRDLKTNLMQVNGHPGSARLGEALAQALGFKDYHDAKSQFDRDERALDWIPSYASFDDQIFSAMISEHVDDDDKNDLMATALFCCEGETVIDDIQSFPEMSKGQVILTGSQSESWSRAASIFLTQAFYIFDIDTLAYIPTAHMWDFAKDHHDNGLNIEGLKIQAIDGDLNRRAVDDGDWDVIESIRNNDDVDFMSFCDSTFARIRGFIPKGCRKYFDYLAFSHEGVRAVLTNEGQSVSIWFLKIDPSAASNPA